MLYLPSGLLVVVIISSLEPDHLDLWPLMAKTVFVKSCLGNLIALAETWHGHYLPAVHANRLSSKVKALEAKSLFSSGINADTWSKYKNSLIQYLTWEPETSHFVHFLAKSYCIIKPSNISNTISVEQSCFTIFFFYSLKSNAWKSLMLSVKYFVIHAIPDSNLV